MKAPSRSFDLSSHILRRGNICEVCVCEDGGGGGGGWGWTLAKLWDTHIFYNGQLINLSDYPISFKCSVFKKRKHLVFPYSCATFSFDSLERKTHG